MSNKILTLKEECTRTRMIYYSDLGVGCARPHSRADGIAFGPMATGAGVVEDRGYNHS